MPDVICDTSPLQYLHQIGLLPLLPRLGRILVPPAVEAEILTGKALGIDLPELQHLDWISIRSPARRPAVPLMHDLGPGETEVLMLGLESPQATLLIDDALARRVAATLELPFTGTAGALLDFKRAGLIPMILPFLDQLQRLRFRLAPETRTAVLRMAGETD